METMHLMDADAREEAAFCKASASVHDLTSVQDYLERRANDLPLSTTCNKCKIVAVTWADDYCQNLEADGMAEEAHEYRRVVDQMARETGVEVRRG